MDSLTDKEYEHGFVTDVEQEFIPKGLNEDIIRLISAKRDERERDDDYCGISDIYHSEMPNEYTIIPNQYEMSYYGHRATITISQNQICW